MVNLVKRDALVIPFNDKEELVIASDNSGSIGMKPLDDVEVPYHIVSYFTFRVAYMECVVAGGTPLSINLMNFNGNEAWDGLTKGINQGIEEVGINELPITGSTESNFTLKQSAMSMTIIGKREVSKNQKESLKEGQYNIAVIGKPLVGYEVINNQEKVAPLYLFQWFSEQKDVFTILPVGSKGIAYELTKVWPNHNITFSNEIDVIKSAGPATCFIVIYAKEFHEEVVNKAKNLLHI